MACGHFGQETDFLFFTSNQQKYNKHFCFSKKQTNFHTILQNKVLQLLFDEVNQLYTDE